MVTAEKEIAVIVQAWPERNCNGFSASGSSGLFLVLREEVGK